MPEADDDMRRLIAAVQGGCEFSFEAMLALHVQHLEKYVRRHLPADLRRVADPEDLVQDTLLEACRRFRRFQLVDGSSMWRWLATIARHRLVDVIRHHRALKRGASRQDEHADPIAHGLISSLQDLALYRRTPSQSAMSTERRLILERAIDELQPLYRDVLKLRYLDGLPFSEIAARIGRGPRAIQMLCNRALKVLRRHLSDEYLIRSRS